MKCFTFNFKHLIEIVLVTLAGCVPLIIISVLCHTILSCVPRINTGMPAVVVVHGGAWSIPDKLAKAVVDGVKMAAMDGFSVLERGGSSLDAVEAAVRNLEDNVTFNAGKASIKKHT